MASIGNARNILQNNIAEGDSSLHFTKTGANPINIAPRDSIKKKFAPCKFFNISLYSVHGQRYCRAE